MTFTERLQFGAKTPTNGFLLAYSPTCGYQKGCGVKKKTHTHKAHSEIKPRGGSAPYESVGTDSASSLGLGVPPLGFLAFVEPYLLLLHRCFHPTVLPAGDIRDLWLGTSNCLILQDTTTTSVYGSERLHFHLVTNFVTGRPVYSCDLGSASFASAYLWSRSNLRRYPTQQSFWS